MSEFDEESMLQQCMPEDDFDTANYSVNIPLPMPILKQNKTLEDDPGNNHMENSGNVAPVDIELHQNRKVEMENKDIQESEVVNTQVQEKVESPKKVFSDDIINIVEETPIKLAAVEAQLFSPEEQNQSLRGLSDVSRMVEESSFTAEKVLHGIGQLELTETPILPTKFSHHSPHTSLNESKVSFDNLDISKQDINDTSAINRSEISKSVCAPNAVPLIAGIDSSVVILQDSDLIFSEPSVAPTPVTVKPTVTESFFPKSLLGFFMGSASTDETAKKQSRPPSPEKVVSPAPQRTSPVNVPGNVPTNHSASSSGSTDIFTYGKFVEKLKDPSAADVLNGVKQFLRSITAAPAFPSAATASSIHAFIDYLCETVLPKHPVWINCSDIELEHAGEGFEKFITTKLWPRIHEGTDEMRQKNTRLYNKILQLQNIPVISLDVLPVYIERYSDELQMAQNELAKIATFRSPRDKSICLINCCKTLSLVIRSHHESKMFVSADELLPLLIYCVIRAQIPSLYLDFEYVQTFRHPSQFHGETMYIFTHLLSALTFIDELPLASDNNIKTEPSTASQNHSRSDSSPTLLNSNRTNHQNSTQTHISIDFNELKSIDFRFSDVKSADDLRLGEVHSLLEQYKILAKFVQKLKQ